MKEKLNESKVIKLNQKYRKTVTKMKEREVANIKEKKRRKGMKSNKERKIQRMK